MSRNSIKSYLLAVSYAFFCWITDKARFNWLLRLKIIVGIALLGSRAADAQTINYPNDPHKIDTLSIDVELKEQEPFYCYDWLPGLKLVEPKFRGGQRALNRFVRKHVVYPEEALKNKVQGAVAVRVTIDTKGRLVDSKVLMGRGYGLDEEALRLVAMMPRFWPGSIDGEICQRDAIIILKFELP
jgi:TonB family protein